MVVREQRAPSLIGVSHHGGQADPSLTPHCVPLVLSVSFSPIYAPLCCQARVTHFPRHSEYQALAAPDGKSQAMRAQDRLDEVRAQQRRVTRSPEERYETKEERMAREQKEKRARLHLSWEFSRDD